MASEFGKPIHHLPLIPANVLKKHCVHEPIDTRFRSAARLLQALWREDQDLPIGSYINEDGKRRKLGSRISEAAGRAGGNFLTPEIAHTARREAAYREIGALIDAERLATNLLSSMPLTFNLLAPWGHALERASSYLIELLPAFTGAARQLLFEHSPQPVLFNLQVDERPSLSVRPRRDTGNPRSFSDIGDQRKRVDGGNSGHAPPPCLGVKQELEKALAQNGKPPT
jgi:hypothetical protein